jgi:calpain
MNILKNRQSSPPRSTTGRDLIKANMTRKPTNTNKPSTRGLVPQLGSNMTFRVVDKLLKHKTTTTKDGFLHTNSPTSKGDTYKKAGRDDFYSSRKLSLDDPTEWQETLRAHRIHGTQFVDSAFPPSRGSLGNVEGVHTWKRITDIYSCPVLYCMLSVFDDETYSLCGADQTITEGDFLASAAKYTADATPFVKTAMRVLGVALANPDLIPTIGLSDRMVAWITDYSKRHSTEHLQIQTIEVNPVWEHKEGYVSKVRCFCKITLGAPKIAMFNRGSDGCFIDPSDVNQGALGDCYFLGALSTLGMHEDLILEVFPDLDPDLAQPDVNGNCPANEQQYNVEGVYAVRFWRSGRFHVVMVDDFIPVDKYGEPAFAKSHQTNGTVEIWALIAEKAFAKLNGSFAAIESGSEAEALQDLTGGIPDKITIRSDGEDDVDELFVCKDPPSQVWSLLLRLIAEGATVCCSRKSSGKGDGPNGEKESDCGIFCNHAYGVLQAKNIKGVARLVQIRNPWGGGIEWNGRWSDNDHTNWSRVSAEVRQRLGISSNPTDPDGTWWMDIKDFWANFHIIETCRPIPRLPNWVTHRVSSTWNEDTGKGGQPHLNPQFHLSIEPWPQGEKVTVVVNLGQVSKRVTNDQLGIAPMAVSGVEEVGKRVIKTSKNRVLDVSSYTCGRFMTCEFEANVSDFPLAIIAGVFGEGVASLANKHEEIDFDLTVSTKDVSSHLTVVSDAELPKCCVCQEILTLPWSEHSTEGEGSSDIIHSACNFQYKINKAPGCTVCGEAVIGSYYTVEGGRCHSEGDCYQQHKERSATKCLHCNGPVCKVEGKFCGEYFDLDGGEKVHAECYNAYQDATADRCIHCNEAVLGSYYTLDEGKCHAECYEPFKENTAEKCMHCQGPVMAIEGRFDGRFYNMDGKGKVHSECWTDFNKR